MPAKTATTKSSPRAAKPKTIPEPPAPVLVSPLEDLPEFVVISKDTQPVAREMTKIFELDGVDYCIPAKPDSAQVMRYLINVRKHGIDAALAMVIADLLGEQSLAALADSPHVSEANLTQIFAIVSKIFLGHVHGVSGN